MKKITSLLALFLICFGITANAQTIESIGENITDPATQLTEGSYVIFKNVSSGKFLYVDEADKNGVKLGTEAKVGAGAEYLWQVHVSKNQYFFTCQNGNFFPRPKTLKETKNGLNCAGSNGAYKGLFDIAQHTTTPYWTLNCQWKEGGKNKNHNKYWSAEGDLFAGIDVASKDKAITQYEIITVIPAKSDDQVAVENIVKSWTGLDKYAGGISVADLKMIAKCTTKAQADSMVRAAVKNPIDVTEYFQIVNVNNGLALEAVNGVLSQDSTSIFNANLLWKLTQHAEGQYSLLHGNENKFVQNPGTNDLATAEVAFEVTALDCAEWSLTVGGQCLALNADGTLGAVADPAAEGAQWYLIPKKDLKIALTPVYDVDGVTVKEAWASVCLPFNATCGNTAAKMEYYGVNAAGNGVAKLQATDGIQAGKGVILHHVGAQVDFGFKIGKNAKNTEDQVWNILDGTCVEKAVSGTEYVLGIDNGVVGLYAPKSVVLKANKAFLVPEVAAVGGFRLDLGESTGIESVTTPAGTSAACYDLSGRRVLQPAHGIYIQNGKKVYIK